jgi:hypothetical protein
MNAGIATRLEEVTDILVSRNIVRKSDISLLSRYFVMPPGAAGKAASPPDKNLLLLLEGFGSSLGSHATFSAR